MRNFQTRGRTYELAASKRPNGKELFIECNKEVTLNVELLMGHGCYLGLRNPTWYVATTVVLEPLLGRPVLEALGINTGSCWAQPRIGWDVQ